MKERILDIIYKAIDNENQLLATPVALDQREDTALYGVEGVLDSMSLVSIVIDVEQMIEEQLGLKLTLVDDRAMSSRRSPFASIGTLANHIVDMSREVNHA